MVAEDGHILADATEEVRGDREVVMTAVAQNGWALIYATEELRRDREVVMTAVAQNGYALEHATEELRGDSEVVMTAVAQTGWALEFATEEWRGDKEVMEATLARASVDGFRPIGLKARLTPTCLLTKFRLCYQISLVCLRRKGPSSVWHALFFWHAFAHALVCLVFLPIRADLETVPSF